MSRVDLNAMEGAEQILNEMNSLHASFDTENPNIVNLDELLQANLPQTIGPLGGASGNAKQVPMYPYMNQPMVTANGAPWVADGMANNVQAIAPIASAVSAPMLNVGNNNSNNSMEISLPSGSELVSQNVNMAATDYQNQNEGPIMPMHQADASNESMQVIIPPSKEVSPTKRNTMSNWTSALSWTKAPRVLVVEDDAVS